jgi:hypothetical protein
MFDLHKEEVLCTYRTHLDSFYVAKVLLYVVELQLHVQRSSGKLSWRSRRT